jgi:hypothetical protein
MLTKDLSKVPMADDGEAGATHQKPCHPSGD